MCTVKTTKKMHLHLILILHYQHLTVCVSTLLHRASQWQFYSISRAWTIQGSFISFQFRFKMLQFGFVLFCFVIDLIKHRLALIFLIINKNNNSDKGLVGNDVDFRFSDLASWRTMLCFLFKWACIEFNWVDPVVY